MWKHLLENDNKAMCMLCNMPLNFSIMNLNFRCCCVLQTANWFENGNVQPIFIFCSILCDLIIIIQSMLQIEPIFRNPLPSRSADLLYCVHRATICWPDSSDFFVFLVFEAEVLNMQRAFAMFADFRLFYEYPDIHHISGYQF